MKKESLTFVTCGKWLSQYTKGIKVNLFLFYLGGVFDVLIGLISPILLGIMIDQIVYYSDICKFLSVSITYFIVILVSCVLHYMTYEQYSYFWNEYTDCIRYNLFEHVQEMNAEKMSNTNYGDTISMLQWQTSELAMFFTHVIVGSLNSAIYVVFCTFLVFKINVVLGIIVCMAVPLSVYLSKKYGKKAKRVRRENRVAYREYVGWLFEIVNSIKDIILLCASDYVEKLFENKQNAIYDLDLKAKIITTKTENFVKVVNTILQMILFGYLVYLCSTKSLSVGIVVIVLTYFTTLTQKVKSISGNYIWTQNQIAIAQAFYDFFECNEKEFWAGDKELLELKDKIYFNKVSFSYNDRGNIISNLSLEIKQGEKIAIVGESGCGKTTLAYMLIGFYQAKCGEIYIDGINIKEYSLHSLRKSIGIVQQDVLLFCDTIRENILLGDMNASDEEIMAACKLAGIDEMINNLENGLDTVIGRGKRELSGGQKQRLAIARIYLKNPKLLIFDEATSALDSDSENRIHEAWKEVLKDRTAIIIAHRLSSVMLCDKVAVMKDGCIVEEGTPNDLERNSERFRFLFAIKENRK